MRKPEGGMNLGKVPQTYLQKAGQIRNHQKSRPGNPGQLLKRAGNETRTRDPQLGKLMLYQLSYPCKKL